MITTIENMPVMLSDDELVEAMQILPAYDSTIIYQDKGTRLAALNDLYRVYVPNHMSEEIYTKLYLSLTRSLEKKKSLAAVKQSYNNYRRYNGMCTTSILGGIDSGTIIAPAGLGKSTAIERSISLLPEEIVLDTGCAEESVITYLLIQCPFDASVKNMLFSILLRVDEILGTTYYRDALKARSTTDMLIGVVSQVCLAHVGVLIVDEIQNIASGSNGRNIIGCLTQLINSSGISIYMVGVPSCLDFFRSEQHMARRSIGLRYEPLAYDTYFAKLCSVLFSYQYVMPPCELNEGVMSWLYSHTGGITSAVVSLIHDAQEIAILDGYEKLDTVSLGKAFDNRMEMMHGYIYEEPKIAKTSNVRKRKVSAKVSAGKTDDVASGTFFDDVVASMKKTEDDPILALKIEGLLREIEL